MIIFLPSCCYPGSIKNDLVSSREFALRENIHYLLSLGFSADQLVIVDNGFKKPSLPQNIKLIHDHSLYSHVPQVGEALMTKRAALEFQQYSKMLKLHSRCKLLNFHQLSKFAQGKDQYLFLRKNLLRFDRPNFNKVPFIETRIYQLNPKYLYQLVSNVIKIMDDSIYYEQAFLSVSYQIKQIRSSIYTHCDFYPSFGGMSGHGINYDSFSSRFLSEFHQLTYRFGV